MLLNIHPQNPEEKKINQVVECLKNDGVIIYPTDTIYTFGCDYSSKKAINRIFHIKNIKTKKKDFSLVCYDLSHISEYTQTVSTQVFRLMKGSLPGPFTFILKANKSVSKIFNYNKQTIGIRVPDNIIARSLVKGLGNPLVSTSVIDEEDELLQYMTDPDEIFDRYGHQVDIVINGGSGTRDASTVIDASSDEIEIIRQGKGILV
jgi:tRNA threonylcarbamoyl adenosine modification protein (Sua5/YciO/YrdC/YwlC family)